MQQFKRIPQQSGKKKVIENASSVGCYLKLNNIIFFDEKIFRVLIINILLKNIGKFFPPLSSLFPPYLPFGPCLECRRRPEVKATASNGHETTHFTVACLLFNFALPFVEEHR